MARRRLVVVIMVVLTSKVDNRVTKARVLAVWEQVVLPPMVMVVEEVMRMGVNPGAAVVGVDMQTAEVMEQLTLLGQEVQEGLLLGHLI
jgi:hypothetical protein